jgi:hypothetical protein
VARADPRHAPRELLADETVEQRVVESQVFAWNPSARGVKSEDTVLATSQGPQVVTDTAWPAAVDVDGLRRPLPLAYT